MSHRYRAALLPSQATYPNYCRVKVESAMSSAEHRFESSKPCTGKSASGLCWHTK
jgi:hypothetical protein